MSGTLAVVGTVTVNAIDGSGAVDIDYGSADITDHTFVSDGGTVILDGEITIDSKYAAVGPDATTGLMIQFTNVTMHAGTVWTQTWTTVFGAAPVVQATYTEDPGDVQPLYVTDVTASNCLVTATADKNFALTAVGARP
jgi:hypothetical protein